MRITAQLQVAIGFIALALVAGPVKTFLLSPLGFGAQYLSPIQVAIASGLAGGALLLLSAARRERLPCGTALLALLVVFAPQLLPDLLSSAIRAIPALHETPWGVAFFVGLSAPLWLALLSALQWIPDQVPRAVVGACIAGIGAACLVVPGDAYAIMPNQIPAVALHVLLGLLTVFTWSYARSRLNATGTCAPAGFFLLLMAFGQVALSPILARDLPPPVAWREVAVPLLLMALVSAVSWGLWFWLLQRMTLAAFGMRELAMWTASIVPGFFLLGFLSWRVDLAAAISVSALVVALRARVADEQPLSLGLQSP